jgi:glycerol-3-phosphate acyltransferase PlsY
MIWPLSLLGGYLLGSISPSYILGRLLRHIDIRKLGDGNAGTVNTYKLLGLWPAVVTAIFDLSKGLLAMFLCRAAGGPPVLAFLAAFAAVLGHVFPFYLRFRGGQGVATAVAILMYELVVIYSRGWLPPSSLLILAVSVVSFSYISRKGEVVASVVLPLMGLFALVYRVPSPHLYFFLGIGGYILLVNILNIREQKFLNMASFKEKGVVGWRLYIRPLAFALIFYYLYAGKKDVLTLVGSVTLFFLLLDLVRLFSRRVNVFFFQKIKRVYKEKEYRTFSSITLFLFAYFLTFLLFDKPIAILATSFLTFGDFFSKFFGILFGRTRIFEKTLEGSLAHLTACLVAGYLILGYIDIPALTYLAGAVMATVAEVLPLGVDDNFSVSLFSASIMYVLHLF